MDRATDPGFIVDLITGDYVSTLTFYIKSPSQCFSRCGNLLDGDLVVSLVMAIEQSGVQLGL